MTLPSLLLGFLISTGLAAAFHLWKGGGAGRLLLDLLLAWVGFAAGQYIGQSLGLTVALIGPLHAGLASVVALAFLLLGNWLSQDPNRNPA